MKINNTQNNVSFKMTHEFIGPKEFIKSFISNGRALAIGGKIDTMSDFFDRDIQKFKDAKIKTTIFYEQNETSSNIWFNADNDTCYIFKPLEDTYAYDDAKKDYIPIRQCADSIEKVKSSYKIIHVADGDEVKINNQFVDSKCLNQNDKEYIW